MRLQPAAFRQARALGISLTGESRPHNQKLTAKDQDVVRSTTVSRLRRRRLKRRRQTSSNRDGQPRPFPTYARTPAAPARTGCRARWRPVLFPEPWDFASRAHQHPILFPATACPGQKHPIFAPGRRNDATPDGVAAAGGEEVRGPVLSGAVRGERRDGCRRPSEPGKAAAWGRTSILLLGRHQPCRFRRRRQRESGFRVVPGMTMIGTYSSRNFAAVIFVGLRVMVSLILSSTLRSSTCSTRRSICFWSWSMLTAISFTISSGTLPMPYIAYW